jgi:UDP-N-acetylmuramate--alanine ligase
MIQSISDFKNPFFIGVAGTGMSAIAQYLQGIGKSVSGSDRYFEKGEALEIKQKLEAEGIQCFMQNGEGITAHTDLVVCSTAIEDTVLEVIKAKELGIQIIRRSELLAIIALSKKTIAIGGTSGKSTTCAMLFNILEEANLQPSIISGAGLVSIINEGKIGNAKVGKGEWLVIEADESDGSIIQYKSEIGLLLNVDKDHKDIEVLMEMFLQFKHNSKHFIVNQSHYLAKKLSVNVVNDFAIDENIEAGIIAENFKATGFDIQFDIQDTSIHINALGRHTMENATAAIAVAIHCGATLQHCANALTKYKGIYRRHQILGQKNGVWLIDDYAHNPVKCAASIAACQPLSNKVIAWFQPHGYGPTKFLRQDFVDEISAALRPNDEIWMSEIFYAGGTAVKDISANDLIEDIKAKGKKAFFVENRNELIANLKKESFNNVINDTTNENVLLLMGARDPSLENFAKQVWDQL